MKSTRNRLYRRLYRMSLIFLITGAEKTQLTRVNTMKNWPTNDNVLIGKANKWWCEHYFGDESYVKLKAKDLPELLVKLDLADSKGEARRNDFSGEIPYGYNEYHYGQHYFYVLNVEMGFWELFYLRFIAPWYEL